ARLGDVQGNARSIDRDPASSPLLGHISCRAAPASRIENQIAGIGRHQDATRHCSCCRLHYVNFRVTITALSRIVPNVGANLIWKVFEVPKETQRISDSNQTFALLEVLHAFEIRFPSAARRSIG